MFKTWNLIISLERKSTFYLNICIKESNVCVCMWHVCMYTRLSFQSNVLQVGVSLCFCVRKRYMYVILSVFVYLCQCKWECVFVCMYAYYHTQLYWLFGILFQFPLGHPLLFRKRISVLHKMKIVGFDLDLDSDLVRFGVIYCCCFYFLLLRSSLRIARTVGEIWKMFQSIIKSMRI